MLKVYVIEYSNPSSSEIQTIIADMEKAIVVAHELVLKFMEKYENKITVYCVTRYHDVERYNYTYPSNINKKILIEEIVDNNSKVLERITIYEWIVD